MTSFQGRRIVLTGISRGVGLETARALLAEGAEILGVSRDPERLQRAARELSTAGGRLSTLCADVSDPAAARRTAEAVGARWGALDVLFNNAGVQLDGGARGLLDESPEVLERSLAINLMAPLGLVRSLLPFLELGQEPRIVNVSSGAGNFESMSSGGIVSYRLSKWALNGLTRLLGTELSGRIAVNAFDPGWVRTDMGGERAPGSPTDSARAALELLGLPFSETGKFWKDGHEIPF